MSPMVKRAKRAVQALGKIAQNEKTITTLEGKRRHLKEKALSLQYENARMKDTLKRLREEKARLQEEKARLQK